MPWFHRKSDEEKQAEQQQRADLQASQQAIQAGGLPLAAQRRLDELANAKNPIFTSDLSVNEFLLSRQMGLRPISQVMGSCVYHVGWNTITSWSGSGELSTITHALNEARRLALSRMQQEAERVGAHIVVGVRIRRQSVGEERVVEFQAFGTAARVEGMDDGPTALTNLSGQDAWKLLASGYRPLGVVAGSTVYHAVPSWGTQWATSGWGGWRNQELTDFTQGLYAARHLAVRRVHDEAANHRGAIGLVGVEIEEEAEEYEVSLGNDNERTDMIFTFHVIGTAIAEPADAQVPGVRTAVVLKP